MPVLACRWIVALKRHLEPFHVGHNADRNPSEHQVFHQLQGCWVSFEVAGEDIAVD